MKTTTEFFMPLKHHSKYSRERVSQIVRACNTSEDVLDTLLTFPRKDARWLVSKSLPLASKVLWAQACADRAKRYTEDTSAPIVHGYASDSAFCADNAKHFANNATKYIRHDSRHGECVSFANEYAARSARFATLTAPDGDTEHRIAITHGVELFFAQVS